MPNEQTVEEVLRSNVVVDTATPIAPSPSDDHHRAIITATTMSGMNISAIKDDESESHQALQPAGSKALVSTDDVGDRAKRVSKTSCGQAQRGTQTCQDKQALRSRDQQLLLGILG